MSLEKLPRAQRKGNRAWALRMRALHRAKKMNEAIRASGRVPGAEGCKAAAEKRRLIREQKEKSRIGKCDIMSDSGSSDSGTTDGL